MLSRCLKLRQQLAQGEDIHKYWGKVLFAENLTSETRFLAKNRFVFPLFYGSWHKPISMNIGLSMQDVRFAETRFWEEYPEIKAYHRCKFEQYDTLGYIETPLGFRRHAPLGRNQQINTEIQGTSFHILLAGLSMLDTELRSRNMVSRVVVEIHDDVLVDTCEKELEDVVGLIEKCLSYKHWGFQEGVDIRLDLSIGKNWYEMESV